MQFYYVRQPTTLALPHKQKELIPPTLDQLRSNEIPIDRVYCGYVGWEIIPARTQIGEANVVILPAERIPPGTLPTKLMPFDAGKGLAEQLVRLMPSWDGQGHRRPCRIMLVNGTGTMLGDTLVGASVLEHVLNYLRGAGLPVEVDVAVSWNARPGVEEIWAKTPGIGAVYTSSITIGELKKYDAYWDFARLLSMAGYASEHFGDFYFNHFGLNHAQIPDGYKRATLRVDRAALDATRARVEAFSAQQPVVFVQAEASTPARSLPRPCLRDLIRALLATSPCRIIVTGELPADLSAAETQRVLNLAQWTRGDLDRYLSAIAVADYVISVDTLALHAAIACKKPGVGLFALSDPTIRLKYSPQIAGVLIPGAERLPYWNKHKGDGDWESARAEYERAWTESLPEDWWAVMGHAARVTVS